MSRLADKINQLNLIQNRFRSLGIDTSGTIESLEQDRQNVEHYYKGFRDRQNFDHLLEQNQSLQKLVIDYKKTTDLVRQQIDELVTKKERDILQSDYLRYESMIDDDELVASRWANMSPEITEHLTQLIQQYSDWTAPALSLHPIDGRFTQGLIACDPLYVVNNRNRFDADIKEGFNPFYAQNRLRLYKDIDDIPDRQMRFALCINVLEYMPLDYQGFLFSKLYHKLTPGAMVLITLNACNNRAALELTLNELRCFSTRDLTLGKAISLGFDVRQEGATNNGVWSWAILQKPGVFNTIKRSATLVKNTVTATDPVPDSVPEPKGPQLSKAQREADYTRRQQDR